MRWLLYKYKCLWSVGVRAEVQVSRRKLHIYIHLDYARIKIISYIKKKRKKKEKKMKGSCIWSREKIILSPKINPPLIFSPNFSSHKSPHFSSQPISAPMIYYQYTHIHLDYARIKILSCIKKRKRNER